VTTLNTLRRRAGAFRRSAYRRRNAVLRVWQGEIDPMHLVPSPVFVLCPARSGSTLLRSVLDMHSQICAPHELHLATMRVSTDRDYAVKAWEALGFTTTDMENLLWDRALHRLLVESGKRIVVDKTPQNAAVWERIAAYWPRARYLHLRRHPAQILKSMAAARPQVSFETHLQTVLAYGRQLDAARAALPGPNVRYEELTQRPEAILRPVCHYLGVHWERRMLHYRPRRTRPGLGDWGANIKSGVILAHDPLPTWDDVPAKLRPLVRAWGY
jgi:hypothetical protein